MRELSFTVGGIYCIDQQQKVGRVEHFDDIHWDLVWSRGLPLLEGGQSLQNLFEGEGGLVDWKIVDGCGVRWQVMRSRFFETRVYGPLWSRSLGDGRAEL